ncbi:MAG: alpha/beta hydrolase fold domain-containing protein [Myxococcota bacterium]
MGWVFLVIGLAGAWMAWNAMRPLYRPAPVALVSFLLGWLTSELALHHLALQLVIAWVFWLLGAFDTTPGLVGLAVAAAGWMGLAVDWTRSLRTQAVVEAAVDAAWPDGADPDDQEPEPLGLGRILIPFPVRRPGVARVRDIRYDRARGLNLKLDVYHRDDRPTGCPALLHVHGGGWVMGSKNEQGLPLVQHMAAHGWVAFNVDYRLSPHATFPEQLVDLKRAIAWVREHGAEWGADPDLLVVAGLSAGGHLASLAALTPGEAALQPGFEEADTRVAGCVSMYGVYDVRDRDRLWPHERLTRLMEKHVIKAAPEEAPDRWRLASPLDQVGPHAPPFLVIHGDRDSLVPVGSARRFVEALRAASRAPVAYAELPGAQHAFDIFPSLRTNMAVRGIRRFLERVRRAHRPAEGVPRDAAAGAGGASDAAASILRAPRGRSP